eukprot:9205504-Alexandrium_andersonii.AAC.1
MLGVGSCGFEGVECRFAVVKGHATAYRAEIWAAILGAARPGPVCIVTGSVSLVRRHAALLKDNLRPGRKPWAAQRNGDLLRDWARVVRDKGEHAISLRWVPGHSDELGSLHGIMSAEDHRGNIRADA